jgi:putative hydrolase of the HAD superfamily
MIRAVLFDLDGTLYDRDAVMAELAHEQFVTFKDRLNGVDEERFILRFIDIDEHGYASRPIVYGKLADEFKLDSTLTFDLERHFWEAYARRCEISDDTRSTLQALRTAGKTLGLITNGETAWQTRKLEGLGLGSFFDVVLISEGEGVKKPDAAIFHRALDRIGVAPAEAMFVGDHPEVDVRGAHDAGLVAVWRRVPYWTLSVDGALVVDRLSEILPVALAPR